MLEATVGQPVQVDISGLETPGVAVGDGVFATGTVEAIHPERDEVTVQLNVAFSGQNIVTVPAERVAAIRETAVAEAS
jgi:transcription antitermination factor NusG